MPKLGDCYVPEPRRMPAMADPKAVQKLETLGFEAIASTPEEFSARIRADIPKWAKVIETAHIKAE